MDERKYLTRVIRETKLDRRRGEDRRKDDRRQPDLSSLLTQEEIAALLRAH